jgi:hypothetical protein
MAEIGVEMPVQQQQHHRHGYGGDGGLHYSYIAIASLGRPIDCSSNRPKKKTAPPIPASFTFTQFELSKGTATMVESRTARKRKGNILLPA